MTLSIQIARVLQVSPIVVMTSVALSNSAASASETSYLPRSSSCCGYHVIGLGDWGMPYHSSTLQEGLLRGYGDFLRSAGQRELLHYEALRSSEAAVEHGLQNAVFGLDVRQRRELMALQHREALRRMKHSQRRSQSSEPKSTKPVNPAAEIESRAGHRLHLAKCLLKNGKTAAAREWFREIMRDYSDTSAARDARLLLAGL